MDAHLGECLRVRPRPQLGRLAAAVALALAAGLPARAATDLTSLSLEQLLQLPIVGASKYEQRQEDVAGAVSVITRQEILAFGWRTIDEALASLPGLFLTYDRQYSYLGARGLGLPGDYNSRVLVTLNGNRLNDPVFDQAPLGRVLPVDIALVERIEFIAGPGGAVYGQNAMFGVVNIVTRDAARVGAEVAAGYQRPQASGEARASWGGRIAGGIDVLLSASALRSQGEDRFFEYGASGIAGVAAGLDGERDRELFASLRRGPWSFDFVYSDRRKDDPTAAFLSDPLVPGQYQADRYTLAQLQYQNRFAADTVQVTARLFYGDLAYRSELRYGGPFRFPADGSWRGAEGRLLYTGLAGHKLMIGVEAQDNFRQEQSALDLTNPANDIVITGSGYRYGLYAQDEWRLRPELLATLGLRVDRNDKTGTQYSPRAGLIWQAAPSTTFKALYGRAHRAPNAYERDYEDRVALVANPSLRGERIDTLELVADHVVARNLALRASVYRWRLNDLITLGVDAASGLPQYQSGPRVDATGAEFSADRTWGHGARLRGSVAFQGAEQEGAGRLINAPRWLAKLNAATPLPWAGLSAAYEWRFESSRLTRDGTTLGGVSVSNLALVAEGWVKGLRVTLGVRNLFNKQYADPAADTNWQNALAQDGRSLRLQLTYGF